MHVFIHQQNQTIRFMMSSAIMKQSFNSKTVPQL